MSTPLRIGEGSSICVDPHDDGVWVSDDVAGAITRLDARTGAIVATTQVGGAPADGARGPDGLEWIPLQKTGEVVRIDPATNAVVDRIRLGGNAFVVRSAFGDMWVDDFSGSTLERLHE
jgi:streptogramin lyase